MEDGSPSDGQIVAAVGYDTSGYFAESECINLGVGVSPTTGYDDDDKYNLAQTEKRCYLVYYMEFAEGEE